MRRKVFLVLLFICGLIMLALSHYGSFLVRLSLHDVYHWRWDMTLDDRPLYLGYALPIFFIWVIVVFSGLLLSRQFSGSWLWPFSGKPVYDLRGLRPIIFIIISLLLLIPLKNRVLDDVFILVIQVPALFLLFAATRGFADRSLDLVQRVARSISGIPPWKFLLLLFLLGALIPLLINISIFQCMPHYVDEINYLFQAKIFAGFRLTADVPPLGQFFHDKNIIQGDHGWYIQHPPGWPAVMAPGYLAGVPWLVNPLLGGLITALVYILGRAVADERVGRLAGVLALLSPYLWLMNAGMLAHTSCALFVLAFLVCAVKSREKRPVLLSSLAGLCLGLAACIRPYSALLCSLPVAFLFMRDILKRNPFCIRRSVSLLLFLSPLIGLLLYYNYSTTGHPLVFGYTLLHGDLQDLGFGKRLNYYIYTPLEGLRTTFYQFNTISRTLFLWPAPSLIPALALFTFHRPRGKDWLLLSIFLALPFGYLFYFYTGDIFNPRFLFEGAGVIIVITATGICRIWDSQDEFAESGYIDRDVRLRSWLALIGLIMLVVSILANFPPEMGLYKRLEGVGPELKDIIKKERIDDSIIFIDPVIYGMGIEMTDPLNLEQGNIYARDLGERNRELMEFYADRKAYRAVWSIKEKHFVLEEIKISP
jgi:hypothetical protein